MAELTLNLKDKTLKKLRAYAVLSGRPITEIEGELGDFFDRMLSTELGRMLELEGSAGSPESFSAQVKASGAQRRQAPRRQDPDQDFVQEEGLEAFSHGLSGDDDEGDNRSLAEQAEQERVQPRQTRPTRRAAPVDDDETQDFGAGEDEFGDLLAGIEESQPKPKETARGGVSKAFDPRKRVAKISHYTGDETGGEFP